MTPCERLSERMPDVARGRSTWNPEEAAHLAACAECQAEWRLVTTVGRIASRAPVLRDSEGLASGVLRQVEADRRARRSWRGPLLGAAAAAALVAGFWTALRDDALRTQMAPAVEIALPELEPLETAELDSLLDVMDSTPAAWSALGEPTLGDLDADELEQVLGTWEG
jgi:hypothetical protein